MPPRPTSPWSASAPHRGRGGRGRCPTDPCSGPATSACPAGIRPGREEDLRLEALVVHPGGAVAGGGDRVLDQHRDLVERLGRDRVHHDVASSFRTRVTVPIWSKDSPAGMSALSSRGSGARGPTRVIRVIAALCPDRPTPKPPAIPRARRSQRRQSAAARRAGHTGCTDACQRISGVLCPGDGAFVGG